MAERPPNRPNRRTQSASAARMRKGAMTWAADAVIRLSDLPDGWLVFIARLAAAELSRRDGLAHRNQHADQVVSAGPQRREHGTSTLDDACNTA